MGLYLNIHTAPKRCFKEAGLMRGDLRDIPFFLVSIADIFFSEPLCIPIAPFCLILSVSMYLGL